ncbi:MAG TPA: hypothetical protein VGS07_16000 [Thermoanaerobaculia bacterium]|nr:hypothetical protein [Thermoanaerobaculia bacterium]
MKGVEEVKTLAGGRALVVLREGNLGKILLLDGISGLPAEIARAPLDGKAVADQDGNTALVFFENVVLPSRAWVIDFGAREVRVPRTGLRTSSQYVLFGEAFGSSEEAQAELLRRFGLPPEREGAAIRGSFLLPRWGRPWILAESDVAYVYFLEERAPDSEVLWTRPAAPQGQWKRLSALSPNEETIDFASGIGAFFPLTGGAHRFFVYDPRLDVILESEVCSHEGRAFLNVDRVSGFKSVLIELTCEKASAVQDKTHFFGYLPGSREVRAITTVPARPPSQEPIPSHLYFDERGWDVWVTSEEIWRSSPGMKDLRLWPPSHP